jgi:hypothetical protein
MLPFGQRQSKCGVPAISIMIAVNQVAPVWTTRITILNYIAPALLRRQGEHFVGYVWTLVKTTKGRLIIYESLTLRCPLPTTALERHNG